MKTKYKYIPITFKRASDAVKAYEDGMLFNCVGDPFPNAAYVCERYQLLKMFTREEVELPTPKEALSEFLENTNVVGITEGFDSFLNNGNHEYDKKWDKKFIEACCVVADAYRALENEE